MTLYRKVITIAATDTPNVKHALQQLEKGLTPDNREICPGVLSWEEYVKRRATWDELRQKVGLDAQFHEGSDILLYPREWLLRAGLVAKSLQESPPKDRRAEAIGVDPGEGMADSAFVVADRLGIIEMISKPTPNTMDIHQLTLQLMRKHSLPPSKVIMDRGGGGKQLADFLRSQGHNVRTVAFGEPVSAEPRKGVTSIRSMVELREGKTVFANRRAEMYSRLRDLLSPMNTQGFGIPMEYEELRRQLSMMPLLYDGEGKMRMLPKSKKRKDDKEHTLIELLGRSPDQSDALVLALHGIFAVKEKRKIGGIGGGNQRRFHR